MLGQPWCLPRYPTGLLLLGMRQVIFTITNCCVTCRKVAMKPAPQTQGQLHVNRVRPRLVFDCLGIGYTSYVLVTCKYGTVRTYVAVFVCLVTKTIHLELVSHLTTSNFITTLLRFIGHWEIPATLWSDYGMDFVGAEKEIHRMLQQDKASAPMVTGFCTYVLPTRQSETSYLSIHHTLDGCGRMQWRVSIPTWGRS